MARGINLRTRLSLSRVTLGDNAPMRDAADAINGLQNDLTRWADALPFGAFGFRASRTNNGANIANGAFATLTFNKMDEDAEGWGKEAKTGGNQAQFYCPAGGSGLYLLDSMVYWGAASAGIVLIPRVLTPAGTYRPYQHGASTDRSTVTTLIRLNEGDAVEMHVANFSGGIRTPTYKATSAVDPTMPYVTAYRIMLL